MRKILRFPTRKQKCHLNDRNLNRANNVCVMFSYDMLSMIHKEKNVYWVNNGFSLLKYDT